MMDIRLQTGFVEERPDRRESAWPATHPLRPDAARAQIIASGGHRRDRRCITSTPRWRRWKILALSVLGVLSGGSLAAW